MKLLQANTASDSSGTCGDAMNGARTGSRLSYMLARTSCHQSMTHRCIERREHACKHATHRSMTSKPDCDRMVKKRSSTSREASLMRDRCMMTKIWHGRGPPASTYMRNCIALASCSSKYDLQNRIMLCKVLNRTIVARSEHDHTNNIFSGS